MTDEVKDEQPQLPAYPEGLFDYTEEQEKVLKYRGDPDDINLRVAQKLYSTWVCWVDIRNNEKLIEIISKKSDENSDEFFLKSIIVSFLDNLGKILGNTHIAEEIFKLNSNKE